MEKKEKERAKKKKEVEEVKLPLMHDGLPMSMPMDYPSWKKRKRR